MLLDQMKAMVTRMNGIRLEKRVADVHYLLEEGKHREEGTDRIGYDLFLESAEGTCCFPDIVCESVQAERLFHLFTEMQVTIFEAPYIVEDLLSDPAFLFLEEISKQDQKTHYGR